ncbi:MAG: hypothetical protein IJ640_02845 [Prevotella sp.]|nr:hypothetical protein [Prevotella sp.]
MRNHTVSAADCDSLIALQGSELATLLAGDISLLLGLSNGNALQLVQSEQIRASNNVESSDGFNTGDGDISNIHNHVSSYFIYG